MSVIGTIMAKLALDITNFSSNLSKIQSDIESTGKKLDGLNNLGTGITNVGKSLTTSLTLPIAGVGTAAVKLATDFEYSMSQVQAISGATGEEFEMLRDEAIELGGSTKFSAGEVADAMTEMAKAGWTTEQILSGMSGVLDAAAASGEGLATVSTIVADAVTGFGLEASDSSKIADLLTQAANSGTIGINDLGESFKYVAPVAGSLGISIEDATTAIAAMSMAGIKGSQAGTSLRTMLANIVNPTEKMQGAMVDLGLGIKDAEGNFTSLAVNADGSFKSLDELVATMRTNMQGMTDDQKAQTAAMLAGKEGMSGLLSLMNLTQEEYDAISASMYGSSGVAQETAEVMQDNLKSAVEQLGGAMESLAIRIGDQLIPIIRKVAEYITAFTEKLAGASEEQIQMGIKIAAVVAAIGPLLMIVGKLITTFVSVSKAITAVKSGFTLLASSLGIATGPLLAIVAAVAAVVAAFVTLWKNNEEFRNKVTEIWTGVVEMFQNFFAQITEKINSLGFNFENFGQVLKAIWQGICDFLAPVFIGVFTYISDTIKTVLDVILGVVDFFFAVFKGDWEGAWNAVKGIFESIWNGLVAWFENIGNTLLGVLDVVLGWFGTSWSECWEGIKTFFENIWNGIVTWFEDTLNGISTFFTNLWTGISTFFQNVWDGITTFFTNIITNIVTFVQDNFGGLFENIKNIFNGIKDFFTGVWELIKNIFLGAILLVIDLVTGNFEAMKSDVENLWNNIKNAFSTIWEAIKTIFSNALNAIKNGFTGAMNAIKSVGTTVLNGIKTIFTNVWNAIKTFFTNAVNNIKTTAVNAFNNMKTSISNTIGNIKTAIVDGFNKAIQWIKDLPSQAVTWGKDMIQGIIDGIKGMVGKIGDAVEGVADKIRSFLGFSVPETGPLHDYEIYMPHMVQGLSKTLQKAAPQLYKTAEMVASGLSGIFNDENLQASMAGAYGSISGGTTPIQSLGNATNGVRNAQSGSPIHIEKIEVRDDNDIEELTQGLYDHNDKSLRAMGRRNL